MGQKTYLNKSDLIKELEEKIAFAEAHVNQVPYVPAEERVRQVVANPCLTENFYLNAIYKEMQTEQSQEYAAKYKVTETDEIIYKNIPNNNDIPAYVAIYKKIQNTAIDETAAKDAYNDSLQLADKLKEQKLSRIEYLQKTEKISNSSKEIQKTSEQFYPLGLFGPFKNYNAAVNFFMKSQYNDPKTFKTTQRTQKQLKVVGLLPQIHTVNYTTTETAIYYIYLDFTLLKNKLKDQHLSEYNNNSTGEKGIKKDYPNINYIFLSNSINLEGTLTKHIYEQFQNSKFKVPESVHKSLKDNRQQFINPEFLYNFTKYISEKVANKTTAAEQDVTREFQNLKTITQKVENALEKLKKSFDKKQSDSQRILKMTALMRLIGGGMFFLTQKEIYLKYQNAVEANDVKTQQELLANPLYKVYINYNAGLTTQLSSLFKEKNRLKKQIQDKKYIYQHSDGNPEIYKQLQDLINEYNTVSQKYEEIIRKSNVQYPQWKSACDEFLRDRQEIYNNYVQRVQEKKEKDQWYMNNFINSDDKVIINTVIMPKSIPISFDFKTLKRNAFKPELDKELIRIKKEYDVQKIYKTDPQTGKLIKPLVVVGQTYPQNWPYKNLYIDTINYNEWMQKVNQLISLRDRYQLLPEKIPLPQEQQPSQLQTFGMGTETKVEVQPPPDPCCDKFFPKNYAQLFGIPDLLPSLLKVDELIFDDDKKPVMIPDPNRLERSQNWKYKISSKNS